MGVYLYCLFANISLFEVGFLSLPPAHFLAVTFKKNCECRKIRPRATCLSLDAVAAFFFFLRNNFPSKMPVIEDSTDQNMRVMLS